MAFMITTVDNPYDPRLDFGAWYSWDVSHGYNTSAYLARVTAVADEFPESIRDVHIELAIDEIIEMHSGGMYKKLEIEDDQATSTTSAA